MLCNVAMNYMEKTNKIKKRQKSKKQDYSEITVKFYLKITKSSDKNK